MRGKYAEKVFSLEALCGLRCSRGRKSVDARSKGRDKSVKIFASALDVCCPFIAL